MGGEVLPKEKQGVVLQLLVPVVLSTKPGYYTMENIASFPNTYQSRLAKNLKVKHFIRQGLAISMFFIIKCLENNLIYALCFATSVSAAIRWVSQAKECRYIEWIQ